MWMIFGTALYALCVHRNEYVPFRLRTTLWTTETKRDGCFWSALCKLSKTCSPFTNTWT